VVERLRELWLLLRDMEVAVERPPVKEEKRVDDAKPEIAPVRNKPDLPLISLLAFLVLKSDNYFPLFHGCRRR
jgi:hypothetical protein